MNILLFGVACIGRTTIGTILAKKLGYDFYDLGDEIAKKYNMTQDAFSKLGTLYERDIKRCDLLQELIFGLDGDKVIAVTELAYTDEIEPLHYITGIKMIQLTDRPENIFNRIVFYDENDQPMPDDGYKDKYRDHYINEIIEDLIFYEKVNEPFIDCYFDINGDDAETAADRLIEEFDLRNL